MGTDGLGEELERFGLVDHGVEVEAVEHFFDIADRFYSRLETTTVVDFRELTRVILVPGC